MRGTGGNCRRCPSLLSALRFESGALKNSPS
nr:MAG TPA: hypothetical protein [Caudoviricetes sp.]